LIILLSLFSYSGIHNAIDAEAVCVQIPSPNLRLLHSSTRRVRQKKVAAVIVLEEENNSTYRDSGRQSIGEF